MAGGVETMSRVPLGAARATGQPYGPLALGRYPGVDYNQITGAELIAEQWGLSRRQLDDFAPLSHQRAAAAIDGGAFERQLVPVATEGGRSFTR